MKSITDLKRELRDAKTQLGFSQRVDWSAGGTGMARYDEKLAVVTRLTSELNRRLKVG